MNERAHHVEVGARRDCRQSALDSQVTPKSIEHCIDWAQDRVESLLRDDLSPLKIIKDGRTALIEAYLVWPAARR